MVPNRTEAKSILEKLANGNKDENTVALIGALAYSFLIQGHSDHVNSTMGPYLDVLSSTNCDDHVIHWSDDQVDGLLANTVAWTKVGDTRRALRSMILALTPSFTARGASHSYSHEHVASSLSKSFALADSRVFSHPCQGYQMHPIIDLINHSHQNNVKWYMPDDAKARVIATRDIDQGEEIFASYGIKPSWDWGADYGFCPDSRSWDDYVAIPLFPLSLNLSEDMEFSLLERLYDSVQGNAILPLTIRKSDSMTKSMRPCILWKRSTPMSELLPIFNPVARVMQGIEKENRVISQNELLQNQDGYDSDMGYEIVLDCLISRLEYLHAGSLISMEWIQRNHETVENARVFLSNRLREAEWNACIDMKTQLEGHVRTTKGSLLA